MDLSIADIKAAFEAAAKGIEVIKGAAGVLSDRQGREAVKEAIMKLQEANLLQRERALALLDENVTLKEEVHALKRKHGEMQKAELKPIVRGAFAYVFDDAEETLKEGPWYCQGCFEAGKKSVFQLDHEDFAGEHFKCPACGAAINIPLDPEKRAAKGPLIRAGRNGRATDLDGY